MYTSQLKYHKDKYISSTNSLNNISSTKNNIYNSFNILSKNYAHPDNSKTSISIILIMNIANQKIKPQKITILSKNPTYCI